jgi:16S rRNA (cytosine1402-N4)-methyltransferase
LRPERRTIGRRLTEGLLSDKFGQFDIVLADLGYNMTQVNDPNYGLSFSVECDLDMRYDRSFGISCRDLLQKITVFELSQIFESKQLIF